MKQIGCCTLCDKVVFEVIRKYPQGHPLEGQIWQIGKPTEDAVRLTFLLTNGSRMDLTFCKACSHPTASQYPKIWEIVIEAFRREASDEHRLNLGMKPPDNRDDINKFMLSMTKTIPLGVVCSAHWCKLHG